MVKAICNVAKAGKEEIKKSKRTKKAKKNEPEYSIAELAQAAEPCFGTKEIIVRAALKMAQKQNYTEKEAKKIVSEFITKEVK